MLLLTKNAELWAPISTIPVFSSNIIFQGLVCLGFFPKGKVFGAVLIYVAVTEGQKIVGTSTIALLTWTSLAVSHLENFNTYTLNLAAPSAQLLPSTAISLPPDPLTGSDCSLWMLADDGGEAKSTHLDLGLLSWAWGTLY